MKLHKSARFTLIGVLALITCGFIFFSLKSSPLFPRYSSSVGINHPTPPQSTPAALNVPLSSVSAQAVYILDTTTGQILGSKNAQFRFSAASTTKLMSILVASSYFKLTDTIVASRAGDEGVRIGLEKGDSLSFHSALYAMLLPSANDVALAVADNYPGGETAFIQAMNTKAKAMHLVRTHFADPAGLEDDSGYTTAQELTLIASAFMENPTLAAIVKIPLATIQVNGIGEVPLQNTNELLGYEGINGIKTGTTEEAWEVLITSLPLRGHNIIITVMKSNDRFADTRFIVDYLVKHFPN